MNDIKLSMSNESPCCNKGSTKFKNMSVGILACLLSGLIIAVIIVAIIVVPSLMQGLSNLGNLANMFPSNP